MFATRTRWDLRATPLAHSVSCARAAGRVAHNLTETNPSRCGFVSLQNTDWSTALAADSREGYAPDPRGLRTAREAVSRYYADKGASVDPEHVFMTASTSEAYGFLFRLLANPGDRVAVPGPSYPLLDYLAELCDVSLARYPIHYDDRWWLDMDALRTQAQSGLKALVTISPNNPTGSVLSTREWAALQDLAATHSMAVIADEVFLDYTFDEALGRRTSVTTENPSLTFTLSGISKILALPQMKLSWMVVSGPDALVTQACARLEMIADTYLSVGTPVQLALPVWMRRRDEVQQEIMARMRTNLALLQERFSADSLQTEGGWSSVLRVPNIMPDEDFVTQLLERDGVLVDPGRWFGFPEAGYVVLSLLANEASFARGIACMESRIAAM